jgi:sister chromatid cohesion protein DCC1
MGDESLRYFSAISLPTDPVARFGDLFLTRPRWRQEDIIPFIEGITVDSKDRDRLLIKFTRSTKDKDGTVWLTATFK